ncbi:lipopolysaccharide biosynthesis protein [Algoriphagus limi]|uniref:Polysaccharide biosynthesis C-terminal domain-containing protein n=1 Tax=Algoriphagus limi TaxID=2975273 RepID=A0ABT2G251_9BACT|nr:polysaccharide biosynthesis C-terminal domain-containing protein [Algoriphagus limi]MCS5489334.1 polysaccharide biosynthesis C-terminal domain-containing protein [Algoriphagus limi]
MGKVANQSFQTAIFSYVGVVIGYINVLWLYPYALEAAQLGTFRTIQDLALLIVPFAQLGLGHGITRYFPKLEKGQTAFLSFSLLIALAGFLIVASLFWIFQDQIISLFASNSPEVIQYLWIVLFITFLALANSILDAYSRSYLKVSIPTFFREVLLRLLTGLWILCFLADWINFDQMMGGLILVYAIPLFGMILYLAWLKVLNVDFSWSQFPTGFRGAFIRFSLITFLATAASTLIMKIDSIMVSSMISLEANAIYTIAFSMALVIEMPRRAISQVIMPVIAKHFSENKTSEINQLYKQVSHRQLYLCLLIFIGIWINIDSIYYLIPNRTIYESGKWVVFWIGLGKVIDAGFSANSEVLVFSKYYKFNLTATVIMSGMIILLNYLLIPIYGIEGAAIASALVMLAFNFTKFLYLKIRLGFSPFGLESLKIIGLGIIAIVLVDFIPETENPILNLLIKSGLIILIYFLAAKIGFSGKEELNWISKKLKKPGP